jgi:hypothetical protein
MTTKYNSDNGDDSKKKKENRDFTFTTKSAYNSSVG